MSNIGLIIEERAATVGNFMVGRLLPFSQKRMIGPFAFIDHMGPVDLKDHQNFDVPPHPHIGLSTLTYLFEGAITHRDSLGTEVEIQPGAVNWMTAGKGVVHSERTPDYLRSTDKQLHGLQIWVALPKDKEDMEPSFSHIPAAALPAWETNGLKFRLLAGEVAGRKSPVPVYSELYLIEISSENGGLVDLGGDLYGESGLYILEGKIKEGGNIYEERHILVANEVSLCSFEMEPHTVVYILGGKPFPEPRMIFWNFVSSDPEKINRAKDLWQHQQMGHVPGETEFVPLPPHDSRFKLKI